MASGRSILVVAAHPDDEVLGCGAAAAKHAQHGDVVHTVILGQGIFSRTDGSAGAGALEQLRAAAREASKRLGAATLDLYDLPDNRMDEVALLDIVKIVEAAFERYVPEIVYTHFPGDLNVDHTLVSEAVTVACRPTPGNCVGSLRYFEVASSTEWRPPAAHPGFAPNLFVDVSETLEKKMHALRAYECEMRPWPHARSLEAVEHQARWRGASAGVAAAEAFVLARAIES